MLLEISGEITPERMKGWRQSKNNSQLWMGLVIEPRINAVKSNCIGTWNVRSMNQGKQEMTRVNIDMLGISKLRWTEWVNLTQMTIIFITVGRNPLEEME